MGQRRMLVEAAKVGILAAVAKSKAVLMSAALAVSLALPVFASDSGDMATLVASTDTITQMVGKVWTLILSNPLLTLFAASSLLSMGIGFFLYLKRAARR